MNPSQALPGFRDFLPEECAKRNYLFAKWREVARRYGFVEWDGPVLEPTDLYRKKSGPEIVAQLFNFTDKGEREVALRPELTPTFARVIASRARDFRKPLKWFSIGQMFRYEKQQRGRLREHYQLNCDLAGESGIEAEIEVIALSVDLLRSLGLTSQDFVVRISDREFWTDFLRTRDVPEAEWHDILQAVDKSEREPRAKTAEKLGALAEPVLAILTSGGRSDKLDHVLSGLQQRGLSDFVKVDLAIVRGLAYYSGVVFEIFDRSQKFRAIAAGGRYDNLIRGLSDGAADLPAIGFAMGDVVLGELLGESEAARAQMEQAIKADHALDVYVVIAKEERRADAVAAVQRLRDAGHRVDYPLVATKVGKQFQTAEQLAARVAVLYGDEWPNVKVKTLATRAEELVPNEQLAQALRISSDV